MNECTVYVRNLLSYLLLYHDDRIMQGYLCFSSHLGLISLISVNWVSKGSLKLERMLIQVTLKPSGIPQWREKEEKDYHHSSCGRPFYLQRPSCSTCQPLPATLLHPSGTEAYLNMLVSCFVLQVNMFFSHIWVNPQISEMIIYKYVSVYSVSTPAPTHTHTHIQTGHVGQVQLQHSVMLSWFLQVSILNFMVRLGTKLEHTWFLATNFWELSHIFLCLLRLDNLLKLQFIGTNDSCSGGGAW